MNFFLLVLAGILVAEILFHLPFKTSLSSITSNLHKSLSVIGSAKISDHWKEKVVLKYSLNIFSATLKCALYICILLAPIALLSFVRRDFLTIATSLSGIILLSIVSIAYFILRKRPPQSQYGLLTKVFHHLALGNQYVREASFDIEQATLKLDPSGIVDKKHVFIAGLARAGTTLLMRRFYSTGQFRSLTYRDMPFVLMPNLWRKLSSFSSKETVKQERAHGDGLLVDYNSPEALEEVFWRTFAGNDYIRSDRLIPMQADDELIEKFRLFVAGVLSHDSSQCYLSKNNNNILRLTSIRQAFPNALIIVPFRDPLQQSDSLLSQHQRFVDAHQSDMFIVQYMRWLAHHEFGYDHRPFIFEDTGLKINDSHQLNYWLECWVNTYRWLISSAPRSTIFLSYETFSSEVESIWPQLSAMAGIPQETFDADLVEQKKRDVGERADENLLKEAYKTYEELLSKEISVVK